MKNEYKPELLTLSLFIALVTCSTFLSHGVSKSTIIIALALSLFFTVHCLPQIEPKRWKNSKLRDAITLAVISCFLGIYFDGSLLIIVLCSLVGGLFGYYSKLWVKYVPMP